MVKRIRKFGSIITCCTLTVAAFLIIGTVPSLAAPVVEQNLAGDLNGVVLNGDGTATLNFIGSASDEYNNMGWSNIDGFLYAVDINGNGFDGGHNGIVRIDPSTGIATNLGNPSLPGFGIGTSGSKLVGRYDAGDVFGNTMYISFGATNAQLTANGATPTLYILDLSAVTSGGNDISTTAVTTQALDNTGVQVNDWAYNQSNGLLYGGDALTDSLVVLNPNTGTRSVSAIDGLPGEVAALATAAYGAAWYDPDSMDVFLYNNAGVIIQVDPSTSDYIDHWTANGSTRNDGAYIGAVVPIPGAVWLFASGLIGLVVIRRKIK